MAVITRSIDLLLRGVRAEFAHITDQAEKQVAAYDANVYLDATNKTGALFQEENAVGRQRWEAISITGVNELLPTEELQAFPETQYYPSYITTVEPFKFSRRIKVSQESADRRDAAYMKALNEVSKLNFAWMNTRNRHRFDRFNTAFSAVTAKHLFDYGDGVVLKEHRATKTNSNCAKAQRWVTLRKVLNDHRQRLNELGSLLREYVIVRPLRITI